MSESYMCYIMNNISPNRNRPTLNMLTSNQKDEEISLQSIFVFIPVELIQKCDENEYVKYTLM